MMLCEMKLMETFHEEENALMWLHAQIAKCAFIASKVAPDSELVETYASSILQLYRNSPISHLAIFFGFAQVGQHYYDEEEIEHFGTFDLSSLMNDLKRHMRIVLNKMFTIKAEIKRCEESIKTSQDIIDGRIDLPEDVAARLSPEELDDIRRGKIETAMKYKRIDEAKLRKLRGEF